GQTSFHFLVANAQAFGAALAERGFDVLAEERGFTRTHQIVTRHGEADSGAGAKAAKDLEDAGMITNMNMLPGDTKPMRPSGLRLGVQELTRVGMGTEAMDQVAEFYHRVLHKQEDPAKVAADVAAFRADYQVVQYCFNDEGHGGYEWHDLV
ncbi:MAG: serine hydroxymethyltransferase, partial [Thermoplasmatota archaeon]